VLVADGEPGSECQIDFARMGMVFDSATGRRRVTQSALQVWTDQKNQITRWLCALFHAAASFGNFCHHARQF
jgi:hypothetical protein